MKLFNKYFLYSLFVFLFAFSVYGNFVFAETDIYGGVISQDTTWTKDGSPYVIYALAEGDSVLTIDASTTLTIEAGTIIKFDYGQSLNVLGKLIANGTADEKVYFTSIYDDFVGGDTNLDEDLTLPFRGDWAGVNVTSGGNVELRNSNISYAEVGLSSDSGTASFENVDIAYCGSGVSAYESAFYIRNSNIQNIYDGAIILDSNSSTTLINSNIQDLEGDGISAVDNSIFDIENSNINNIYGDAFLGYSSSTISIKSSTINNVGGDGFNIDENSVLNLEDSNIKDVSGYILSTYDTSTANIINSNFEKLGHGIDLYNNSIFNMTNSKIDGVSGYFEFFNNSVSNIINSQIKNVTSNYSALLVFGGSHLNISNSSLQNIKGVAIEAFSNSRGNYATTTLEISSSTISDGKQMGLEIYGSKMIANISETKIQNFLGDGVQVFSYPYVLITDSEILNNNNGIVSWGSNLEIKNSIISGNKNYGISNLNGSKYPIIKAINNWWGNISGPNYRPDPDDEVSSSTPNQVSWNIEYQPWLKYDPNKKRNPVIIIPGILSSYLNKTDDGVEVWPNIGKALLNMFGDTYLDDLIMNEVGHIDINRPSMTTSDIFRKIQEKDFFDGLINKLKDNGYIENENLLVFPYDWRLDIRDNVDNLYSPLLTTLKNKIDQVLTQTGTGKVDIIAHSMGGFLSKYYIEHYGQGNVDKFIDIATPHLGSPNAFKTLMYGDDLGIKFGILGLNPDEVKKISQNMPSIYQLLPSPNYFSTSSSDYNYYVYDMNDYDNNGIKGRLDYGQSNEFLKDSGRNSYVLDNSMNIHDDLDNMNPADFGVKTYNIVGCGTPTLGKIFTLGKQNDKDPQYDIAYISGDGTVPERSAEAIPSIKQYYVSKAEHSTIPSSSGVKELVNSILFNNEDSFNYASSTNVSTSSADCKLPNGTFLGFHSPVELNIYDEVGNHTGPDVNGDLEQNIPDIAYDIIDGNKFAYLPDGQDYRIELKATETGSFSAHIKKIQDGNIISTDYFNDIPLSSTSTKVHVDIASSTPTMALDQKGDGIYELNISPSAVLTSTSIGDLIPPQTTNTVLVNGTVSFLSTDDDAGVLKTEYSFDGNLWNLYTTPFTAPGKTVKYFSTDNAGNIESIQSIIVPTLTGIRRARSFNLSNADISTLSPTSISEIPVIIMEKQNNNINTDQSITQSVKLVQNSRQSLKPQSQLSFVPSQINMSLNNKTTKETLSKGPSLSIYSSTSTMISKVPSPNIELTASVISSGINIEIIVTAIQKFFSHLFLLFKNIL